MKKLMKKIITSLSLALAVAAPASLVAAPAFAADIKGNLCSGINLEVNNPDCNQGSPEDTVNNIITTVINILSLVVGVVAVVMIIIGGIKYITSGGESANVTGAKNTILFAVVGLVIVALAQVIVRFVLNKVQNV